MIFQRIRVSGVVHGVGYRPFVWRLAKELKLTGWVRNDAQGVEIEACGQPQALEQLLLRLRADAPEMARVDAVAVRAVPVECRAEDFYILNSRGSRSASSIERDMAICRDCLAEMFDPDNRRWRYAFASCARCGPRYTINRAWPFARERTSLKPFTACAKCQNEVQRADDRHYKNEVNCCSKCGPQLALLDAEGHPMLGDPAMQALALLSAGKIVAIKGVGGFHLACDARNAAAVAALRERRQGDQKPFAVMVANATSASAFVKLGVGEPGLLGMPERPIILLKKRSHCDRALPGVAAGLRWLGVMLPSTALHYLIFHAAAASPDGLAWLDSPQELALVMRSAAPDGEPVLIDNSQAVRRLSGIADAFLLHDREIVARCADTVARTGPGGLQLVRRARGYAPHPLKLPRSGPPVLAVGGRLKNAVCVTRGDEAFISPHIGDLDNAATCDFFDETIAHLLKFLEIKPALVAHDLGSDLHSTRFAAQFAHQRGVPLLAVQHDHAHVAAVLAEHQVEGPVIALALDGISGATNGGRWGGALLRVDGVRVEGLGHLAPIQLTGEPAGREPWRAAAAVLQQLGRGQESAQRFSDQGAAAAVAEMLARGGDGSVTSSLGCYINAAAALLRVRSTMAFNGQAAMLLEGLADHYGDVLPLNGGWAIENGCLSLLPLFAALADETNAERGAALFHATLAAALADWVGAVAPSDSTIVGSGACCINLVLARGLRAQLGAHGMHLIAARRLPPNDGGLALGQAWVAQHYLLD